LHLIRDEFSTGTQAIIAATERLDFVLEAWVVEETIILEGEGVVKEFWVEASNSRIRHYYASSLLQ
jgi:hypothetical protein